MWPAPRSEPSERSELGEEPPQARLRLVVTTVRPHPTSHSAERAFQRHPASGQGCCCCGCLHIALVRLLWLTPTLLLERLIFASRRTSTVQVWELVDCAQRRHRCLEAVWCDHTHLLMRCWPQQYVARLGLSVLLVPGGTFSAVSRPFNAGPLLQPSKFQRRVRLKHHVFTA